MLWTFLNDKFIPKEEVRISPFNRGFLFGDGVYEVIPAYNSIPFLLEDHLLRLERSLHETNIKKPLYWDQLRSLILELVEKNQYANQSIYIQITRGEDEFRSHIPSSGLKSTMFISSNELLINPYRLNPSLQGLKVEIAEDPRWNRSDIKATTLFKLNRPSEEIKEALLESKSYYGDDYVDTLEDGVQVRGVTSSKLHTFGGLLLSQIYYEEEDWKSLEHEMLEVTNSQFGNTLKKRFYAPYMQLGVASYSLGNWCTSFSSFERARKIAKIHKLKFPATFDSVIEYAKSQMETVK